MPYNVTIVHTPQVSANGGFGAGTWTPSAIGSQVADGDVNTELVTTNVTVTTTNGGGGETGNITVNGTADTGGAVVIVNGAVATPRTLTLTADPSTGAIDVHAGAQLGTAANTSPLNVTLTAGVGVTMAGTITTSNAAGTLGGNVTITAPGAANGIATVNGNIEAGGTTTGGTVTFDVGAASTMSGVLSGANAALTKAGTGTLTLSGTNTYTGATSINAGTLVAANNVALGAASGGTTVANGANLTIANVAIGNEAITLNGGSALSGTGTASLSGAVTLNANSAITVSLPDVLTLSGVIDDDSGGFGITKAGSGTLILGAINTYTGATNINGGVLSISADANLGAAPGAATPDYLTFDAGTLQTTATFTLNANRGVAFNAGGGTIETATGTTATYAGIAAGAGSFTKAGAGTLALQNTANTYSGATTIAGGVLAAAASGSLGDGSATNTLVFNGSGATLLADGTITSPNTRAVTLASDGTIDVNGNAVTIQGIISGLGTLNVTNSNISSPANVTLSNTSNALGTLGTVSLGIGSFTLVNSVGLTISGAVTVGALDLSTSSGGINQTAGGITAGTLQSTSGVTGTVSLNAANDIAAIGNFAVTNGDFSLTDHHLAVSVNGALSAANVTLTADDLALTGTINAGTGGVTLSNATAGRPIDLGTDMAASLGLTAAELNQITADTLTIGSGSAGHILVSAAIAPAHVNTLALVSGGSIGLAADVSVTTLSLNAPGGISQTGGTITATNVDANALAGTTSLTSASNAFSTITGNGTGGFTVVDSHSLSTGFGGVLSALGDISLTVTGTGNDLTVALDGAMAAGGTATLTAAHNVILNDTVSAASLLLDTSGETDINVALGNFDPLGSLTTDAGGTTHINGGSIETSGAQVYHDAVVLGAATALTGTAITFDLTVDNGGFGLTVTNSSGALFSGAISGGGGFTQAGSGTTTLAATETYTGATLVSAGTLLVDGSIANSTTIVAAGATLGGHGTTGAVNIASGGTLSPGDSPGILTTGDLSLSSGASFDEQIGGTTPGGYDQVQVHGTVSLGAATLNTSLVNSYFPSPGDLTNFTIIDNDGTGDPVTGTFAGLAEGAALTIGSGTFAITYHGGDGNDVVLLAENDLPQLSGLGDTPSYTENGAPVVLNTEGTATVSDAELDAAASYAGAALTLARHGGANPDDLFSAKTGGTLDLTDGNVTLDHGMTIIGTVGQADGMLTITFNSNASADAVDQVMRQLAYANASDNPPTSAQIDFTFSDGNGQPGGQDQGAGATPGVATGSVTVGITQVDDAPVLINVALGAAYGIGSAGAVLSPALGVFDVDATPPSTLTGLASATIQIANGLLAGDQLFVNLPTSGGHFVIDDGSGPVVSNIAVQSNASGALELAGQDTVQHWQLVLDRVSYMSTAADPTAGGSDAHRTVTWTVNDGSLDSQPPNTDPDNLVSATILHFDTTPVLDLDASAAGTGFTTTYTENNSGIGIVDSDVTISDSDSAAMASATVVLTNAKAGDSLSIAGALPDGIDSSIDTSVAGKITVHLLNSATLADYQTALRQITFVNSSDNPSAADRDITVVVSDGEVDSNTAHATVHVVPVNDAPVVTGSVTLAPIDQNGSARLITQSNLLSNATDVDGPSLTAIDLATTNGIGTLIDNHNGTWSYTPGFNDASSVSFSYHVTDGIAAPVSDKATLAVTAFPPVKPPSPLPPTEGTSGDDTFFAPPGSVHIDGQGGNDTITFNFKLIDATVSYFGNQVIIDGPTGSHTVLSGFETYVFTDGTVQNNDGNPLVDDLYYYSQYHDVWNAHLDADTDFNTVGWKAGRNPDAFFSTVLYLSANPDVKAAGVNPLTHYDTFGWQEGRDPSILFDTDAYLKAYPDVAAAHVDPLAHFLQYGAQEGRTPFAPASILAANGFDYVYYLQHNPDVAAANADPLLHYEVFGWKEGRDPNAFFDDKGYLANYPDVAAAGVNPLDHYHIFGWQEGRDPSVNFDTTSYLAAYPDVAAAHIDPLKHFLQFGQAEGRSSFADGIWG